MVKVSQLAESVDLSEVNQAIKKLLEWGLLTDHFGAPRFFNDREMNQHSFRNEELAKARAGFIRLIRKFSGEILLANQEFIGNIFQKLSFLPILQQFIYEILNQRKIPIKTKDNVSLTIDEFVEKITRENKDLNELILLPKDIITSLAIEIYHTWIYQNIVEEIIQKIIKNRDQEPNLSAIARKWSYPISKIQKIWETIASIICQIQQNGFINDEIEKEIGESLIQFILDQLEEARIITRVEEE